jgi:DNA-binding transcriptional LysR family regulator
VPLFERRSRGVALTEEGTELLADVSAAFFRLSEATGKLRRPEVTRRVSGVVRNVQSSFAFRWLFPRLTRFQGQFPYIDVRVSTTSRKLRYIGSAFDIGVRSAPERGAGLRSEPLMADRRRSACSPELLRKRPVETVHDLRHHYDPALRHDALFLVSLAIRSRRREPQELSSTGAGARVSSASSRSRRTWRGAGVDATHRGRYRSWPPCVSDRGAGMERW